MLVEEVQVTEGSLLSKSGQNLAYVVAEKKKHVTRMLNLVLKMIQFNTRTSKLVLAITHV